LLAVLVEPASAGSFAYTYDALGRLTQASLAGDAAIAYRYDPAGNRNAVTVTAASAAAGTPVAPSAGA
jgi:YD repeat-containing protein